MVRHHQAITATVALVGLQDTHVQAHRPHTDGAAVSIRIGAALIYMHDPATVEQFIRPWEPAQVHALSLPANVHPEIVRPIRGMRGPTVMVEAAGSPPVNRQLHRVPGRPTRMQITLGRLMFDIRDAAAFTSTAQAFRDANTLAASIFPASGDRPTATELAGLHAALVATRPFKAPRQQARTAPAPARPTNAAPVPSAGATAHRAESRS